jgi:hypothetical protein
MDRGRLTGIFTLSPEHHVCVPTQIDVFIRGEDIPLAWLFKLTNSEMLNLSSVCSSAFLLNNLERSKIVHKCQSSRTPSKLLHSPLYIKQKRQVVSFLFRINLPQINRMSDLLTREETNPRSSSHAQLFIIVHPSNVWSFATFNHAKSLWLTTQARQTDIPKVILSFNCPGEDVKYFEIASIPNSWLRDVQIRVDLVPAVEMEGDLECNHRYVRDVLNSLVVGGILGEAQVSNVLLELEVSSQLQLKAS